jgi:hypothetical protein
VVAVGVRITNWAESQTDVFAHTRSVTKVGAETSNCDWLQTVTGTHTELTKSEVAGRRKKFAGHEAGWGVARLGNEKSNPKPHVLSWMAPTQVKFATPKNEKVKTIGFELRTNFAQTGEGGEG